MSPSIFALMAISGILAIVIYLGASEKSNKNIELAHAQNELERKQFDKDFSDFMNDGSVDKVDQTSITQQKQKVEQLEEKKRLADLEEENQRKEIQKALDNLLEKE